MLLGNVCRSLLTDGTVSSSSGCLLIQHRDHEGCTEASTPGVKTARELQRCESISQNRFVRQRSVINTEQTKRGSNDFVVSVLKAESSLIKDWSCDM